MFFRRQVHRGGLYPARAGTGVPRHTDRRAMERIDLEVPVDPRTQRQQGQCLRDGRIVPVRHEVCRRRLLLRQRHRYGRDRSGLERYRMVARTDPLRECGAARGELLRSRSVRRSRGVRRTDGVVSMERHHLEGPSPAQSDHADSRRRPHGGRVRRPSVHGLPGSGLVRRRRLVPVHVRPRLEREDVGAGVNTESGGQGIVRSGEVVPRRAHASPSATTRCPAWEGCPCSRGGTDPTGRPSRARWYAVLWTASPAPPRPPARRSGSR